jgi:eukaryotic-like serine/threonine-protein kinase
VRPELNSATTTTRAVSAEQERLARILDEYLVAIEQGKCVSPEELLAKYPDDAAQLRGYLSGLQLFHAAAVVPAQTSEIGSEAGVPPALQTIGDYRLVREIGRGGMGVVYEAWQVSLRRRVALKVLPFTSAHDAKHISRFKNEAQAAAQAQHPNIVPVFAIGEENGTHFYVMQLIEGQSLTSLLGALRSGGSQRGGTTAPLNSLTCNSARPRVPRESTSPQNTESVAPMRASETADHVRVVARLGIQGAEALHAAHEIGIVHRDVKPSNLLLDDQGKLWVTDFGLARCRENQGLTQTGDVLGTMRYASPEQALGRVALVDERTDVYSLGLTMYELATLNHPADELSDMQLLFDRNRPAVKPLRHWNRSIPRDFETIVLKCMSEFPQERYSTARELAEDLERFLEGRPIVASPPSLLTWAGKWAKRRRGVVYAAAAVLVVALTGLYANMMLVGRERNERVRVANEGLREMQAALDRSIQTADRLQAIPGAEGVRHDLLQEHINLYQKFVTHAVDDPSLTNDMAVAYSKLGTLNGKLENREEALKSHILARDIWQKRLGREPQNSEYARNLALSLNKLGLLVAEDGRPAEALELLKQALKLQSQLAGVESAPAELASELAMTHSNLGLVLMQTNAKAEATNEFRQAIAIQEPLAKSATVDEAAMYGLAAAYHNFASLQEGDDPEAAASAYQKAIENQRELVKAYPLNRMYQSALARTYNNLGFLSSHNKGWKNAELCYADAIRIQDNLVKGAPRNDSYHRDLAISYNNLGMAQSRASRFAEAETSFRKAEKVHDELLVTNVDDVQALSNQGSVWNNLGMLYDRQQRLADAADAYQHAIHFQSEALGRSANNDVIRSLLSRHYYNHARNLVAQAKYEEAVHVALERGRLWAGKPERLYSVAQELAGMYRQINGKAGAEQTKSSCVEAAAATLREALAAGLSRDRLQDRSLTGLTQDVHFGKLMDAKQSDLSQK